MSVGGAPVITIGDTPVSVPESLDPDTDGFLDPVLPIGEMASLPQIQVMSPTLQATFGYEAVLTQTAIVERLKNQPYISDSLVSDTVVSAPSVETQNFQTL